MNPVLPLPLIIPLILGLLAVGIWLSWKSTAEAPTKLRRILLGLRTLVLITIAILLLNPGKWKNVSDEAQKIWVCLIDDTASMTAPSHRTRKPRKSHRHRHQQRPHHCL